MTTHVLNTPFVPSSIVPAPPPFTDSFAPPVSRYRVEMSILRIVARHTKVPINLLLHPKRGSHCVSQARQLSMYLMHVVARRTMVDVGVFLGRDRSTVSHACNRIEDLRDNDEFDEVVACLEQSVERLLALDEAGSEEMRDD